MKIGGKYNWKGQPERLVYLGCNWSGNGYWHQFAKADGFPSAVWCEVLDADLHMIEETTEATKPQWPAAIVELEEPDEPIAWRRAKLTSLGLKLSHGAKLYATPQPCQSCAEKQSAIDVWEGRYADLSAKCAELRVEADFNFQQYQDLGEASHQADMLQEARFNQLCQDMDRMTAQRDILQSRIDTTQKFLEFLWRDAQLNDYTFGRFEEILAMLNLAAMKPQEPVGYQELFDAIAAATSVACFPGINISIEDFTAKIGPLYATPQPCPKCAEGMVSVTKEDANNYCRILTLLGMEEEGSPVEGVERLIPLRDGMTCGDCNDTGWLENREDGRYPCTCMTEAEPYQILQAKCAELEAEVEKWSTDFVRISDNYSEEAQMNMDFGAERLAFILKEQKQAERIAELESKYSNALNRIVNFEDMVREYKAKIKELEADARKAAMDSLAAEGQLDERIQEIEAERDEYRTKYQINAARSDERCKQLCEMESERDALKAELLSLGRLP